MFLILSRQDESSFCHIFDDMFQSRARLFGERLRWDVAVKNGRETDRFDEDASVRYAILTDSNNRYIASARLLPSEGPTLLNTSFACHFPGFAQLRGPGLWECNRLCYERNITQASSDDVAILGKLLHGICSFAMNRGIENVLGVFGKSMQRIYSRVGWTPTVLADSVYDPNICLGMWRPSADQLFNIKIGTKRNRLGMKCYH